MRFEKFPGSVVDVVAAVDRLGDGVSFGEVYGFCAIFTSPSIS